MGSFSGRGHPAETALAIRRMRESFSYDAATGHLIWADRPSEHFQTVGAKKAFDAVRRGRVAGGIGKAGHRQVNVFGRIWFAHRIIWAMHYGRWPYGEIDHENGNPSDNRLENLRDVGHAENMRNLSLAKNNSTGVTGVMVHTQTGAFVARIKIDGRTINLGSFQSIDEAATARQGAERAAGFHKNHGRQAHGAR